MSGLTATALVGIGVAAFSASAVGAGLVRRWATRRRILDLPNERSSHRVPTPRGGGLAIVAVTLVGIVVALATGAVAVTPAVVWATAASIGVAAVSLLDDLRTQPVAVRLAAHLAAAVVAVAACGGLAAVTLPGLGRLSLGWLGAAAAVVWVVGLTNATNFMDGIDGIAAGQGLVAGVGWVILGPGAAVPLIGMLLAAASAGFLVHNWPPARLFMGDVGSAFLGYWLAVLALLAASADGRGLALGLLFVWPFVFDTSFTFLRRLRLRENVLVAHRSHLYQRLVIAGWGHGSVSLLYAGLAGCGVALAAAWRSGAIPGWSVDAAVVACALGLGLLVVTRERLASAGARAERAGARP